MTLKQTNLLRRRVFVTSAILLFHCNSCYAVPSQTENAGELLYNGIRLPKEWPPHSIDPKSAKPMPVPYLEHPPKVIPIDVGRQLFVDDFLIETTGLHRVFHYPEKYEGNPVLKPETDLETGSGSKLATACPKSGGLWWNPEKQLFELWYEADWFGKICYATSVDGLKWNRPALDAFPGSNQVSPAGVKPDSWTVVRDWWTDNPKAKYKIFVREPGGDPKQGAMCFESPDGIHWGDYIMSSPMGDRSTMFYNPFRHKWIFSLRSNFRGRSRHYLEADDFIKGSQWVAADLKTGQNWKEGQPVVWADADELDPPDPVLGNKPQLYNLDAVAYESLMLGFYQIWRGPDNDKCGGVPKITELNFAYSRDGFHWSRPDRTTAIKAERKAGTWDRGYVQSLGNICTVRGDKLWFYYTGFSGSESKAKKGGMYANGAMGVAFLRRDGFASMDAGKQTATLTTRPVTFSGKQLFVNAASTQGKLRCEVLDENEKPLPPFTLENSIPFSGDSTIQPMTWEGGADLSVLCGRPVRFRFELTDGALYSFWISKDSSGRSDGFVAGGGPGFTGPTDTVGRTRRPAPAGKVYVLLFGGQSNALGWGYQQYLEDTGNPLRLPQPDIDMFYEIPGTGLLPEDTLLPLQSGNSNTNVKQPGEYPALTNAPISRFGPELSFARTVRDRIADPDAKVAVIKFAMGGTSLWDSNDWLPDGTANSAADSKLYRIFQDVAWKGIDALKKKYPDRTVEVLGMGWVQGESDALEGKGAEYQKHLTDFITDVRATFGTNLTFVLSKISPNQIEGTTDTNKITQWPLVRAAQDVVAATVPNVAATETTGSVYAVSTGLSEGQYHYKTPGLLQIGRDLGNALITTSSAKSKP